MSMHARVQSVIYLNLTTTGSDRISSFFHPDKVIDFYLKERAPAPVRTNYCDRPIVIQLRTTTQL